jgi:putative addiction module CopG family antidote
MPQTRALSITLSTELAQMLKDKVASGAYESESEVVRAGLRALQAQDAAVEEWLRTEGVARYDAYRRDPSRGRPAPDAFARLRRHHDEMTAKARG